MVITSAKEEENPKLIEECKNKEIRVIFSEELEKLILRSIIESIDLKEIFDEMKQSGEYSYLDNYWETLETEKDFTKVFSTIDKIVNEVR